MKVLYFDCIGGISGDMILAAFLDAGLSFNTLKKELKKLPLTGYNIKKLNTKVGEISATRFIAEIKTAKKRSVSQILNLIRKSKLNKKIKTDALKMYENIIAAERVVHREKGGPELHELSDEDSIIDIVGISIAKNLMGIEKAYVSEVPVGKGIIESKGGLLPLPAPATLTLLKGFKLRFLDIDFEFTTPTGACAIKTFCKPLDKFSLIYPEKIGYGAGTYRIPGYLNLLRIIIGNTQE